MNYDEITKITAERISDYMTEAVNTDSIAVAEMFHNAAWGVRTLWFERKRLVRTVLIFTESSDQLSRATDRVPGLPASPGYVQ